MLGQGFGPNGKHKMGMQGLYAGKAYADKKKMMEALRIQRITGRSKPLPLATEDLLENTDGVGAPHQCSSQGGILLPSYLYADARCVDAIIVSKATAGKCHTTSFPRTA